TGALQEGDAYTSTLKAVVPPVKTGQYRVIIRTDIYNEVYEATNDANNTTTSPSALSVDVDMLHLGVPIDTTLDTGQERVFRVTVPQGQTLRATVTSDEAAAANELFLRYGDAPSSFQYDAAYDHALQANQTALIPSTKPGDYYILLRGQSEPVPETPVRLLV